MSLPPSNELFEASLVDSPQKRTGPGTGCLVAAIVGCVLFVLVVGIVALLAFQSPQLLSRPNPEAWKEDLAEVRTFLDASAEEPAPVTDHPDFDRINDFVSRFGSRLDYTANPTVRKMIDHQKLWAETCDRSSTNFYSRRLTRADFKQLVDITFGPQPVSNSSHEIMGIEPLSNGRFRVALSYDYGYGTPSLFVWWLCEEKGRLFLYDWFDGETGVRHSLESARLIDANLQETIAYQEWNQASEAYLNVGEDLEYAENQRAIRRQLQKCEASPGPQSFRDSNLMITAKRWASHGYPGEAMRVLDQIADPNRTPGVFLARANIHYDNGLYADAASGFGQYLDVVGDCPFVRKRLIACARHVGDFAKEKVLLQKYCKPLRPGIEFELSRLMELNEEPENEALLRQIDALSEKEAIYTDIVRNLKGTIYFREQYQQLAAHLESTLDHSLSIQLAGLTASSETEEFVKVLRQLDAEDSDSESENRSDFWYSVPEDKLLEVFRSTSNRDTNFDALDECYRYEGYHPDCMAEICKLVLEVNPESRSASSNLASFLIDSGDATAAIEILNKLLEKEGDDDEDLHSINDSMMRALSESGEPAKAAQWAADHDLVDSLLNQKVYADDFTDFELLLQKLDKDSSNYKYYRALLQNSRGETDKAIASLIALVGRPAKDDTENYSRYQWKWKLREILTRSNQLTQHPELLDDEDEFWNVADSMIAQGNWNACENLLELGMDSLADAQRALRIRLDWEQGNDRLLANLKNGNGIGVPNEYSNLSRVLRYLVYACVKENDYSNAKKWAAKSENPSEQNLLLAGIAISEGDFNEAENRLRLTMPYNRQSLTEDSFLWNDAALEQPNVADLLPACRTYNVVKNSEFSMAFLFDHAIEPDQQELKERFIPLLGTDMTVKRYPGSRTKPAWITFSNGELSLVLKISTPQYRMPDSSFEVTDDVLPIQKILSESRSRIDASVHSRRPLSRVESARVFDQVANGICDLEPRLFGVSNAWLTPDKFDAWFSADLKNRLTLETAGGCGTIHAYPVRDIPEVESAARKAFETNLVAALKSWLNSRDKAKFFSVETSDDDRAATRYRIEVSGIRRLQYQGLNVVGLAKHVDNVPQITLYPGEVSVSLSQITSFEAAFDQQEFAGSLR